MKALERFMQQNRWAAWIVALSTYGGLIALGARQALVVLEGGEVRES